MLDDYQRVDEVGEADETALDPVVPRATPVHVLPGLQAVVDETGLHREAAEAPPGMAGDVLGRDGGAELLPGGVVVDGGEVGGAPGDGPALGVRQRRGLARDGVIPALREVAGEG